MTLHSRVCFVLFAKCRVAWVTRPASNWVKATSLLLKHEKSDWHLAAVEKQALSLAVTEELFYWQQVKKTNLVILLSS